MGFNQPFATSEIIIGSDKNKISISNTGDMVFVDGSFAGTEYEDGITLADLANAKSSVTLDDLIDTTVVVSGKVYSLLKNIDGSWSAVEYTAPDNSTIIEVEPSDWAFSSTLIDGGPGYSVMVPHNLGLSLPSELLTVGIWTLEYEAIILSKVKQNTNSVYLESMNNIGLYVTMRKE